MDDFEIEEYPAVESFSERLIKRFSDSSTTSLTSDSDLITNQLLKLKSDLSIFKGLNDPRGVYAKTSLNIRID